MNSACVRACVRAAGTDGRQVASQIEATVQRGDVLFIVLLSVLLLVQCFQTEEGAAFRLCVRVCVRVRTVCMGVSASLCVCLR